jgi:formylglycine-generating enzyme required for sulfatase activity
VAAVPTVAWDVSKLPTVTPLASGEPTLPPAAQAMHAAPTATPGAPSSPTPLATATSTRTAVPTPTQVVIGGQDNVPLVEIPSGKFVMGTDLEAATIRFNLWYSRSTNLQYGSPAPFYAEVPSLTVSLPDFQIDQIQVTNARYRKCVAASVCPVPDFRYPSFFSDLPEDYYRNQAYDDYPALMSWHGANAYCQWAGKRLPTEAEWEKAARGTDGRLYPWGNNWDEKRVASTFEPVGHHLDGASPYGVQDMISFAPQWTLDVYQVYPGSPFEVNDRASVTRVARGGNVTPWSNELDRIVSVRLFRDSLQEPSGFRCVQASDPIGLLAATISYHPVVPLVPTPQGIDRTGMVYVPAGEFIMGTSAEWLNEDPSRHRSETPQHVVYLDGFYLDKNEVTAAEYAAFLTALGQNRFACEGHDCAEVRNQQSPPALHDERIIESSSLPHTYQPASGYERYPVTGLSWYGAKAYCTWKGKRLPTEAEWEKAARGTDGRRYPWGNQWDSQSLSTGRSWEIYKVGSDPLNVSPYGAVDMLGNAGEWAFDWASSDYYAVSPYRNPQGPQPPYPGAFELKALRSPAGDDVLWGLSDRNGDTPDSLAYLVGVRCAYSSTTLETTP